MQNLPSVPRLCILSHPSAKTAFSNVRPKLQCAMRLELLFKASFVLLFVSAVAIRVHYQRAAGTYRKGVAKHAEDHLAHEAKPLLIIRPLLGLPWYGVVLC